MKQIIYLIICLSGLLFAQSYDLQLVETQNDNTIGGVYEVLVQIRTTPGQTTFKMGASNLVFSYDLSELNTPILFAIHNFSGIAPPTFYQDINITMPMGNLVSVNIENLITNNGVEVLNAFMDVTTIRFTIVDPSQAPTMVWRMITPNRTVVFADDDSTIITSNELTGLPLVECSLSDAGVVTLCNNNNSSSNPNDDTYTFTVNPTGTGLGSTYSISGDVSANNITYGAASQNFGPFNISDGNKTITITDDGSGSCQLVNVDVQAQYLFGWL